RVTAPRSRLRIAHCSSGVPDSSVALGLAPAARSSRASAWLPSRTACANCACDGSLKSRVWELTPPWPCVHPEAASINEAARRIGNMRVTGFAIRSACPRPPAACQPAGYRLCPGKSASAEPAAAQDVADALPHGAGTAGRGLQAATDGIGGTANEVACGPGKVADDITRFLDEGRRIRRAVPSGALAHLAHEATQRVGPAFEDVAGDTEHAIGDIPGGAEAGVKQRTAGRGGGLDDVTAHQVVDRLPQVAHKILSGLQQPPAQVDALADGRGPE